MRKIFLLIIFILGLLVGVFVFAQITYPIKELGNCQNEAECKTYCDKWENIEECVSFAEAHNLLSPEELAEAKKIIKALAEGAVPPGGCSSPTQCKAYCEEPSLIEECITFAEKAGIIPPSEAEEARLVRKALLAGIPLPGNCGTKKNCDAYCSKPAHTKECIQFTRRAGLISAEEAAQAEKVMPLMAKGESPGDCKSKEECETYCADESHTEECVSFILKAGLITEEEAKILRRTGGTGPGDCKSKIECDAFCNNSANQETCLDFALQYDLMPQEEIQKIREGAGEIRKGLEMATPELLECLNSSVGPEVVDKIRSGNFMPTPLIGDQIKTCFDKYMTPPPGMPPE
ncbi:hypothetical protein KJA13_01095 [Patescibacteria group bacterium]|nr:hypothetical protein [Patescibacteria group bacterium]